MQNQELFDTHGRKIDYIRVSLTDRCNFRCIYCMPPKGEKHIPHAEILSYEELLRFLRITAALGISRYKITGGEPLCRRGIVNFIRRLKALPGVAQCTLTTNGSLLARHVDALADTGLDGINVSFDSLSPQRFAEITRSTVSPEKIIEAITIAKRRGLHVKINVVPLRGYNETDLPDLTLFALNQGCHIRFIELMPLGRGKLYEGLSQDSIRRMVKSRFGRMLPLLPSIGNGPAECFSVEGCTGSVGFISAISKKFCHACNRVRLTSVGFLKTCLHHNIGVDIKPLLRNNSPDREITHALTEAVRKKPMAHDFSRVRAQDKEQDFFMNSVGG